MYKDNDNQCDDAEQMRDTIQRFEAMLQTQGSAYFDTDEFEWIIDYYMQQDDLKKSRKAVDIAIAQHPEDNHLKIKNARQFLVENHPEKAMSLLNDAEISYEDPDYFLTLGSCYAALGQAQKSIETYFDALQYFEEDEKSELYNAIAYEYEDLFDYCSALIYFKKALDFSEDTCSIYHEIRHCYFFLDRTDDAVAFFKKRIEEDPHDSIAWSALGDCYRKLDLLELAIDTYEYVLAIDPTNIWPYVHIANAYYDMERFQEAIDTLNEALSNKVETSLIHTSLGDCFYRLERPMEACQHYKTALQINESLPEAWSGLGFVYSDQNESSKAIRLFEKARLLDPCNPDHLYSLAAEYRKLHDYETAYRYLFDIESIDPTDPDLYYFIADILNEQQRYDEAINILKIGQQRAGNDSALTYMLSYDYLRKNDRAMALTLLEDALNADFKGHQDFLDIDPDLLYHDIEILEMIDQYKKKS